MRWLSLSKRLYVSSRISQSRVLYQCRRSFSQIEKEEKVSVTPPYPVRALLVGSSVGLASPVFAVAGAAYFWFNYLPKSNAGITTKYTIGILAGGGMSKLTYQYIWPFLMSNSELVLPFAVANGVSAAFWYSVGEGAGHLFPPSFSSSHMIDPSLH